MRCSGHATVRGFGDWQLLRHRLRLRRRSGVDAQLVHATPGTATVAALAAATIAAAITTATLSSTTLAVAAAALPSPALSATQGALS